MVNKVAKSFSIDIDLVDRLNNESNASDLVNRLIHTYYFDTEFSEKTLEEKIKEAEILENQIIKQREEEREKIQRDIEQLEQRKKEMEEKQKQEIEDNINLIEAVPNIPELLINDIKQKGWNNSLILDYVSQFRQQGVRVGTRQLRQYLNSKGIIEQFNETDINENI